MSRRYPTGRPTGRPRDHRDFPVQPIVAELERRRTAGLLDPQRRAGVSELGRTFAVSPNTAGRWLVDGLTLWEADRAAAVLDLLPTELWGAHWIWVLALDALVAAEHRRLHAWVARTTRNLSGAVTPQMPPAVGV